MDDSRATDDLDASFDSCDEETTTTTTTDVESSHCQVKQHFCSYKDCLKSFNRLYRLIQHERIHTGERPYVCSEGDCKKSYARSSHLKRHVEQSHKVRTPADVVVCNYDGCYRTFVSKDNLKRHVHTVHQPPLKRYMCKIDGCNKTFSKRFQLRYHEFEHKGVDPFQCHIGGCKKQFHQKSHLVRHLKSHEGYKCDVEGCNCIFEKWSLLRKHKSVVHKKFLNCPHCQKLFSMENKLKSHKSTCHLKIEKISQETHSGSETETYVMNAINDDEINSCGLHDLNINKESKTLENPATAEKVVFPCNYEGCTRCYTRLSNLKHHVNVYHKSIVTFRCDWPDCNNTFASKQKLKNHERIHSTVVRENKKTSRNVRQQKQSEEMDIADILENFDDLNSPFYVLNKAIKSSDDGPRFFDEDRQMAEKLKRMRQRINRKNRDCPPNE